MRGLETPGAPIIAPGETYRDAKDPHGAGDLYEVHALQVGMTDGDLKQQKSHRKNGRPQPKLKRRLRI